MKNYYVYILTNKLHPVLYIGITNDLERRLYEHRHKLVKGFTSRYNLDKLVHIEHTNDAVSAIAREKQLKGWLRKKKDALIAENNSDWHDLSKDWE